MIPNLLWKVKIPESLPKDMQFVVDKLKKSKGKEGCLIKTFNILSKKYHGCSIFTRSFDLFVTDLDKLWKRDESHCTNLNYLLRVLLVKSGFFNDEDIKLNLTLIGYVSIHQYLSIRINDNKFVNVDMWGASHEVKFGDYAHGFHYSIFQKISTKLKNFLYSILIDGKS